MARAHGELALAPPTGDPWSPVHVCHGVLARLAAEGVRVADLHVDRLIGLVAAQQDAVVTGEQLAALGLRRGAIEHRVRRGILLPRHRRVYTWGPPTRSPWTAARAAVLACRGDALVTHDAALGLYRIRQHPEEGPVDVTVVGRRARVDGVRTHSVQVLAPDDRRRLRGIPVASPARALVGVAGRLAPLELADAVERAQVMRLVTKAELAAALARAGRGPGVATLRSLVEERAFSRSRAERRLIALLRAAQLPQPVFNADVNGWEVDALWQRHRVALEFDSYAFHATRAAFERDRRKGAALARDGYLVLRTTWTELTRQPYALVARTAEALARRR